MSALVSVFEGSRPFLDATLANLSMWELEQAAPQPQRLHSESEIV